jgi:Mg-chelatase subunit ChlD
LIDTVRPVKVLFLIDTSGSNSSLTSPTKIGTDDGKVWRLDVVNNFIDLYGSKSNFYFGLVTFQGKSATPKILIGNQAALTNNLSAVKDGIERFSATRDADATPYKAALAAAKEIIAADIKKASSETAYAVVMISDGAPSDYDHAYEVTPDVQDVLSVAPKQISVNTVFYYKLQKLADQTSYLQAIAKAGNGSFVTANSNQSLKIDDVIKVPQTVCK